ncbi:MAG: hypothetical protein VB055_09410 [Oscillospiraceae bacterium]|nr:hypothetical protein [Oscillospiraceae bacterium]
MNQSFWGDAAKLPLCGVRICNESAKTAMGKRNNDTTQTRGCFSRDTLIFESEKLLGDPKACAPYVR